MGKPVIANIRPGDPDGSVWDLTLDTDDDFFAVNASDPDAYDALIAKLNLEGSGLDLSDYGYVFLGTNGADTITGVTVEDEVEGDISGVIASGNGSDEVTAGAGDHVIFAGNGSDTVSGGGGADIIFGENGKDDLSGNGGDDEVHGGKGKDTVVGGLGDDVLTGNNGGDVLTGGEGADDLTGGNGGDEFHWNNVDDFGDVVTDFTVGSDKLVFDVADVSGGAISVGNNDLVVDAAEVVILTDAVATANIQTTIDTNTNTTGTFFAFIEDRDPEADQAVLYYDPDPNTDGGAVLVAEFPNITATADLLAATDFMFV